MVALLITICVALPILALAAQRNDFKRLGLIAMGLEATKYVLLLIVSPIRSEFFNFIFTFVFYIAMLPEMMIGTESGPSTVWQWIARISAGIVWNLAPAYLITLCLSDRPSRKSIEMVP
ncbi:MAG TPA: hypothetical protein VFF31_18420 [Blastocatellia bacterium]|nr:hypothetical protein [Blastocatellia bacterium]